MRTPYEGWQVEDHLMTEQGVWCRTLSVLRHEIAYPTLCGTWRRTVGVWFTANFSQDVTCPACRAHPDLNTPNKADHV